MGLPTFSVLKSEMKMRYIILLFYFALIFGTSTIGHFMEKGDGFGKGMIVGFIVSTFLWYKFGKTIV